MSESWEVMVGSERHSDVHAMARLSGPSATPAPDREARPEGVVGESLALDAVLRRARKVAPTQSTVLISGETGTGKELLARAVHHWSRRAGKPFVSVNCAAIPQSLIASELFGHERGAFTGALRRRPGRFERAAGGTLFMDEVGDLPEETQVSLLRVLQEREFERVGGTVRVRADVRVIAASNRNLEQAVSQGDFRSDLYYRLNVFPLHLPPLRDRRDDIRLLVEHFVDRFARRAGRSIRGIHPETLAPLEAYPWPGNVRELQNLVERSLIVCESDLFSVDESWLRKTASDSAPPPPSIPDGDVPRASAPAQPRPTRPPTLDEVQRQAILDALRAQNGIIGGPHGAAARLGVKRTTLQARMRRLGITLQRSGAVTHDGTASGKDFDHGVLAPKGVA
jgi:transcriptional regulator with GAF, ATPase, and Fis domain